MSMFPGFRSDRTKELAGNCDHVSRVPKRQHRAGRQLWVCFQGSWATELKSWPATMIIFTGFLSDGTKELPSNNEYVSRVPERWNQRAGRQLWSYLQGFWVTEQKSWPATVIMFPGFLSDRTELAGNYEYVSRVPERQNQRAGWQWWNQRAARQLWVCFQGSWATEPKSWPATMIIFTGFLSDRTKELADNYDHVSRVPERWNQRTGRQLWSCYHVCRTSVHFFHRLSILERATDHKCNNNCNRRE